MALIQWSENLSVHVTEMDKQHQKLFALINELNEAMSKGKGKEVIGKTINGLLDYTKTHFAAEEKLLGQFAYAEIDKQKSMHKIFIDRITDYKRKYESGGLALSIDVMNFLSDWLKNHIQIEDKKYGPFLATKGIK